jgi:RNA polymerase sigma-70 factor (ECF subfamily)
VDQHDSFQDVIGRLRAGDDEAARQVFGRFAARLVALARSRLAAHLRQKVDAEDVVQSVFKSFFRRHADERFEVVGWDSLWSLLTVLTVRKCANQAKRYQRRGRDLGREVTVTDYDTLARDPTPEEAAVLAETLEEVMRGLTEREREMVALSLQGKTIPEVSALVARAERTVRRVLDQVRHRLERMQDEDRRPRPGPGP